ncbi:MAG: DUF2059 domain-containing protein [Steroidobacteraceae bacterium]
MNTRAVFVCAFLLAAAPALANDGPPTEESIQQLLTLSDARELLGQMKVQMETMMSAAMRDAQQGQTLTPERQAILDRMRSKMSAVVSQSLNWDALQPIYVRTYQASLTQDELDGIINFYQSPAGQAYIKKMPLIMQNVMAEMQVLMKPMQQKLVEIRQEATQELKDLKAQGGS